MPDPVAVGLTHLTYRLPSKQLSIGALGAAGLLTSEPGFLEDIGFGTCYIQEDHGAFAELVIDCGRALLSEAQTPHEAVRWLFWYAGLGKRHAEAEPPCGGEVLHRFRYPVARAQHALGLERASALALSEQACSGLLATLALAAGALRGSDAAAALCLAGDVLPPGARREIIYNVMSDAAGAVLLEKDPQKNRILHFHQQAQPYYWDSPRHAREMLASYFPLAQRVIRHALEGAGLTPEEVDWFVPHNVSLRSWEILAGLLGVPIEKVWCDNIGRVGHTVSCDQIINLCDMEGQGVLRRGDILVLFTIGFGATWTCMVLEH